MKKKIIFALLISLLTVCSVSCTEDPAPVIPADLFDEDGSYIGFEGIPATYTAKNAIEDGCLVIDIVREPNQYGALITKSYEVTGRELWDTFLSQTEKGKAAHLRVASFLDGVGYYHDLYYRDGGYKMFTLSEYGVSGGKEFKYLRKLVGLAGPVSDKKESTYYVLTDSLKLTHDDVYWFYLSSNLETVTKIPFVWLSFTVYLK